MLSRFKPLRIKKITAVSPWTLQAGFSPVITAASCRTGRH